MATGVRARPTGVSARQRALTYLRGLPIGLPAPVFMLTALGAVLRFGTLDAKSFWEDEATTVTLLDQGFGGTLEAVADGEAAPPLYYALVWLWSRLLGLGEVGVRSFSALVGTGLIVVAYLAARELLSRRASIVVTALVAVNPLLVWYSQEARLYALFAFLAGVSFLFFLRARNHRPRALWWWAVSSALAIATHYFAIFIVFVEAVLLLRRGPRPRALALAVVPIAAVVAALVPLALAQDDGERAGWIAEVALSSRVLQVPGIYLTGFEAPSPVVVAAVAALIALLGFVLLLLKGEERDRRAALLPASVGIGAVGLALLAAFLGFDYFIYKNLIASVLPLAVALGAALGAARAGRVGIAAAVALCALSLAIVVATAWEPKYHRDDWRGAAEAIGAPEGPRALVVTPHNGSEPLTVYTGAAPSARSVRVREVAVVALPRRPLGAIEEPVLPRPRQIGPPAPGFDLVERREAETYTLARFRADTAKRVTDRQLERTAIGAQPAILLEGSGPRG